MRRSIRFVIFILFWLGGWTFGGISIGRHLLQKFNFFEAFWMCGWIFGEVAASYAVLRMLGGSDIVQVDHSVLEIRKEVFGLGISKQYSLSEIRDLRFQAETSGGKSHRESRLAFDYGAKTITFGDGIDEGEANQLIRTILDRYKLSQPQGPGLGSPRFWRGN